MKTIFKIIPIFITVLSCKAQSPIINIVDQDGSLVQNAYYKDIDNLLNPFEGTYIYNSDGKYLKLVLQKKVLSYNGFEYNDMLIGEYQYIENGVEKTNTLNKLNINYTDFDYHSLSGNAILKYGDALCRNCVQGDIKVMGGLVENLSNNSAQIIISKLIVNGQPAINLNVWWQSKSYNVATSAPGASASFSGGDYIMVKQ